MGWKLGGSAPFWGRESWVPSNAISLGLRPIHPYRVASWSIQPFGLGHATDTGRKLGGSTPLWGGEAGSPSKTMWPGPRPICIAKFHLDPSSSLATVHQRLRQTGQRTGQTGRQRFDSIGWTVLQTVAQKENTTMTVQIWWQWRNFFICLYASCFLAMMWGKLWQIFVIAISLSRVKENDNIDLISPTRGSNTIHTHI